MLISSANKTYLYLLETFTKSFMYKLKRIGLKTDICGTPYVICSFGGTILPNKRSKLSKNHLTIKLLK